MDLDRILRKPFQKGSKLIFSEIEIDMDTDDLEILMIGVPIEELIEIQRIKKKTGILAAGKTDSDPVFVFDHMKHGIGLAYLRKDLFH